MESICSSCARRIARGLNGTFSRPSATHRAFSSTPATRRSVAIPVFPSASSTELNSMLSKLRTDHIMPSYLTQIQRRLVYRKKNMQLLENTDSTIERGGETLELRPLDQQALQSERKRLVPEIVRLIVELDQWAQLVPLLEANDARKCPLLSAGEVEDLLRRACSAGKFNIVLECMRAAKRSGLDLHEPAVLRIALRGPRMTAEHAQWSGPRLRAAAKQIEDVIVLLRQAYRGEVLPQGLSRPATLALPLEIYAVITLAYGTNATSVLGKVEMYYTAILSHFESDAVPAIPIDPLEQLSIYQSALLSMSLLQQNSDLTSRPAHEKLQRHAQECGSALAGLRETIATRQDKGEATEYQLRLMREIDGAMERVERAAGR